MQNITTTAALGTNLRKRRKELGLTQLEAAGLCGVGERFLRELEHGKATVEFGKTLQVIRGLGLKLQLPETGRDRLARQHRVNTEDTFGLIGALGRECAGALRIVPKGELAVFV